MTDSSTFPHRNTFVAARPPRAAGFTAAGRDGPDAVGASRSIPPASSQPQLR